LSETPNIRVVFDPAETNRIGDEAFSGPPSGTEPLPRRQAKAKPEQARAPGHPPGTEPLSPGKRVAASMAEGLNEVQRPVPAVKIVTADDFANTDEAGAAAILGTSEGVLIPEGGDAMIYGDGGVGKTTLMIDLAYHLAAGDPWLGIAVAGPVRVLIIENEGPRPQLRRKFARKQNAWAGGPVGDRLLILEEPWGRFSYARADWRANLAAIVSGRLVDVVIVGPLASSGMEAAGTLQDVREFLSLVEKVRADAGRRFVSLLVHHENRGGKVSGAWEGACDTLLHALQQGHGKLRLYVQKARWSSEHHATKLNLIWADGDAFALSDEEPSRPERAWDDIAAYVLANGGCAWNVVNGAVPGKRDYLIRRRDQMLVEGVLVNAGTGNRFELWHRDDPARPTLDVTGSRGGTAGEPPDSHPGGEGEIDPGSVTGSPVPALKGEPGREPVDSAPPDDPSTEELRP
jgi:AAA domain